MKELLTVFQPNLEPITYVGEMSCLERTLAEFLADNPVDSLGSASHQR